MGGQRTILVTGAEGFVGSWLIEALARDVPEADIVAGCRDVTAVPGATRSVPLDVTERDSVRRMIAALKPTGVVHLAAVSTVREAGRDRPAAWAVNVGGTLNLAEAVLAEAGGARFVFAGSAEVYGDSFASCPGPLDETAPLAPLNSYARTKAAADLLLGEMAGDGLAAIRMRPFNHTGPGQGEGLAVSAFAAQIARIEAGLQPPVLRTGNLDARRDFLDVRDVVNGYVKALTRPDLPHGRVYNLASGEPIRIGDMLDLLLASAHVPIRVELDPDRLRPSDTPVTIGSAERARTELAWDRAIPLERMLADVLESCRATVGQARRG